MAIETRTQLKTYFQTGDKPTQAQFINFIDSAVPFAKTITFANSPYTVLDTDFSFFVDTTGGHVVLTIPLAASFPFRMICIKKIAGANDARPTTSGGDNIEGVAGVFTITNPLETIIMQSNGVSDWWLISHIP